MERSLYYKIVDAATDGNQSELARQMDVSPQLLTIWRNTRVPAEHVVRLTKLTKGKITPHDVRPDVFLSKWKV